MKERLLQLLRKSRLTSDLAGLYFLRVRGFLNTAGWFRSFSERLPVDPTGKPLPWFTYASIHFLKERVRSDMVLFEYGCGNSSRWWAALVSHVYSCEHDHQWFEQMRPLVPSNVTLQQVDLEAGGAYARSVLAHREALDIVVIDGRDRVNCARYAVEALKPDGVIVWDNSDRPDYEAGYQLLRDRGFKRIDFVGMGPIGYYGWATSVFYRPENCLGI